MRVRTIFLAAILLAGAAANAQQSPPGASPADARTKIDFPPEVRDFFLSEMRGHMAQLDKIISLIAAGDMKGVSTFAGSGLAIAGAGHAPGSPSPGRYAPPEFRALGQAFHGAGAELAKAAGAAGNPPTEADYKSVMEAVSAVTASCAGCHGAFRVR